MYESKVIKGTGHFFENLSVAMLDMSMPAQYRFHVYLVANPKRELEFKMAVTVVLQDIHNMYITRKNPYVYILFYIYILLCLSFKN